MNSSSSDTEDFRVGDSLDSGGYRIKLKSSILDIKEIEDMGILELKRARRELLEIMIDGRHEGHKGVALSMLNAEISKRA